MKEQDVLRRLFGTAVGAAVGIAGYWFLVRQGIVLLALVGGCLGLLGGMWSLRRSRAWGIGLAVVGVALTIGVEWRFFPFIADESLGYFLANLHDLSWRTHLSILFAAFFGYHFGQGRDRAEDADVGGLDYDPGGPSEEDPRREDRRQEDGDLR